MTLAWPALRRREWKKMRIPHGTNAAKKAALRDE